MSHQGLDEVIAELKNRGLRAGEEEGEKIVDAARAKARQIVDEATTEAQRIRDRAKADAQATRTQLDAELRQASAVGLEAFRQAVEQSLLVPELDERLGAVLEKPEFLKDILVEAVQGFARSQGSEDELTVLLPASRQKELEGAFVQALRLKVSTGISVRFEEGFDFGFQIAPQGGGYVFDFTEEGFREILLKFLAPRFRTYFFQEE